jgi:hypothetical protein
MRTASSGDSAFAAGTEAVAKLEAKMERVLPLRRKLPGC